MNVLHKFALAPVGGARYTVNMRIISRKVFRKFWGKHPDAEQPLRAWLKNVKQASWQTPSDVKNSYRSASFVANNRVIFNIKGNHYRIVIVIKYQYGIVYIRFVGTHSEYDKIDTTTI